MTVPRVKRLLRASGISSEPPPVGSHRHVGRTVAPEAWITDANDTALVGSVGRYATSQGVQSVLVGVRMIVPVNCSSSSAPLDTTSADVRLP